MSDDSSAPTEPQTPARIVTVITGAGSGIGRETALRLARRGDAISVWDRDSAAAEETVRLVESAGGTAMSCVVDVVDEPSIAAAASATIARFGSVANLITGAGYSRFVDFVELTIEEWNSMIAVHLTGAFLCSKSLAPTMLAAHYGRIVFISSLAGLSGSAGHVHYAAAKAGIIGYAKALAKELGPEGITVNCIAPGSIDTPMLADIRPEIVATYRANPMGRLGTPSDIARAIEFFTQPEGDFVTGTTLSVSGGAYT